MRTHHVAWARLLVVIIISVVCAEVSFKSGYDPIVAPLSFARLPAARALLDIARSAEEDARSIRDIITRRAELGKSSESDRIRAVVVRAI